MSVQELAYDLAPPLGSNIQDEKKKAAHMEYGATNALSLYNTAAEEGVWGRLQEVDASFMRTRARKHEELSANGLNDDEDESEVLEEDVPPASKRTRLSPTPPPVPKVRPRKHPDARVLFHMYAYARKQANVDEIRFSEDYEEDPDYTGPVSAPRILRTTPNETLPQTKSKPQPTAEETATPSKSQSKKPTAYIRYLQASRILLQAWRVGSVWRQRERRHKRLHVRHSLG
jgi:hypothetical protein